MIKYYKLFDLLNRRGMKKSDLREILSPNTIAKLSKGENVETSVIDKICIFLECQPGDIMEVVEQIDELTLVETIGDIEPPTNNIITQKNIILGFNGTEDVIVTQERAEINSHNHEIAKVHIFEDC